MTSGKSSLISISNQMSCEDLAISTWNDLLKMCKDREDCFFGKHPTLRQMNEKSGVKSGQILLSTFLNLMNVATNVKTKLSDVQIIILSEMIYEKFFYLKDSEISLFFYDYFRNFSEDRFYGSIETTTIIHMLTKWVREKRGKAKIKHKRQLWKQKEEENKHLKMNWKEHCKRNSLDLSESPVKKILSSFGKAKAPKDTKESTSDFAKALIVNRFGFDEAATVKARRAFILRYGYTPEDYLRKEGIYE